MANWKGSGRKVAEQQDRLAAIMDLKPTNLVPARTEITGQGWQVTSSRYEPTLR